MLGSRSLALVGDKIQQGYQDKEISKIDERQLDKEFTFNKYLSDKYQMKISNVRVLIKY